jgi:tRNA dimethylallyltransferase
MENALIVIAGVTGSGKSKLAIQIAKKYNAIIINADSRQVYKELNIATDKPIPDEIYKTHMVVDSIKHYLYGYKSIYDNYTLYDYQKDVTALIKQTPSNIPILLVGGTGLYINSIIYRYNLQTTTTRNIEDRNKLSLLAVKDLQAKIPPKVLKNLNNSDRNNPRRLIRIIERGGINTLQSPLKHLFILKDVANSEKHKRDLEKRIEHMFKRGLKEEIANLYNTDTSIFTLPALNTIGYIEFAEYFTNNKTLNNVREDILQNTLRYVKKQRTWFKKNKNSVSVLNTDEAYPIVDKFITELTLPTSNN